jgi:hypothetical protein
MIYCSKVSNAPVVFYIFNYAEYKIVVPKRKKLELLPDMGTHVRTHGIVTPDSFG